MTISNYFQPPTHTILDQFEMVYYLHEVMTQIARVSISKTKRRRRVRYLMKRKS